MIMKTIIFIKRLKVNLFKKYIKKLSSDKEYVFKSDNDKDYP